MILQPAVIALLTGSFMVCFMTVYSLWYGLKILFRWNLQSGSEDQLVLEKKTYIISTCMVYSFAFLIISFFLFIATADDLHRLFVGAMCAAGTLRVNNLGYPLLGLKTLNCILAGTWLIINYTDNQAIDYPLIKKKYAFLALVTPFVVAETVLQGAYFLNLKANVITSCCGSLFSLESEGVASSLSALPVAPMRAVFFGIMFLTFVAGLHFLVKISRSGYLFSFLSVVTFLVSIAALISFISLYFYELPTHHCPFCILHREYHFVGYVIYTIILGAVITGVSVGFLLPCLSIPSLEEGLTVLLRRLTKISLFLYGFYSGIVLYKIASTDFILTGY